MAFYITEDYSASEIDLMVNGPGERLRVPKGSQ